MRLRGWLRLVGGAAALGLLLAFLIGRAIAGPVVKLSGVMRELAGGHLDVDITDWLLWRTEYKVLFDTQGVFPNGGGYRDYDQLLVGSLTIQVDRWA